VFLFSAFFVRASHRRLGCAVRATPPLASADRRRL
jgi:hypothetical protein